MGMLASLGCGSTATDSGSPSANAAADSATDSGSPSANAAAESAPASCMNHFIQASSYDQSCNVDTDCVAIAEGDTCVACAFSCGNNAAISKGAVAEYNSAIAGTSALAAAADGGCFTAACGGTVSGRSDWGPFCCGGICHVGSVCPNLGDAGDAAAE
jgi:hypothetical protein